MNLNDREVSTCIFCEESVLIDDKKFNLPIDKPIYCNIIVHRSCYNKHYKEGTLRQFLYDNLYSYLKKYEDVKYGEAKASKKHKRGRKNTNPNSYGDDNP